MTLIQQIIFLSSRLGPRPIHSFKLRNVVEKLMSTCGSFHVKSTDGFHGPPPILLKYGTLVGIV